MAVDAPKYNRKRFEEAVQYALTLTRNHSGFYPLIREAFEETGVIFIILPNIAGSEINGATKKIGNNVMLMVNDRRLDSDSFWFTLFHEIDHIINGDYGISFDRDTGEQEEAADLFVEDSLIPRSEYDDFVASGEYGINDITRFAESINRDPGIVLGRLQNDGLVGYDDAFMKSIRHKYKVKKSY